MMQPTGARWTFGRPGEEAVLSNLTLGPDGSIHLLLLGQGAGTGLWVVAVGPDGSERWRHRYADAGVTTTPRTLLPTPGVGADGDVWILHRDRVLRLSAVGAPKWTFVFPRELGSLATLPGTEALGGALATDGSYYFTHQSFLVRLSPDGAETWRTRRGPIAMGEPVLQFPANYNGAPALGTDGVVYASCVACGAGQSTSGVAAFDAVGGATKWVVGREMLASEISGPVADASGRLLLVVASVLVGASSDGAALWPAAEGGSLTRVPLVLTASGNVLTCRDQSLAIVRPGDGSIAGSLALPGICSSVSVVGGTIWVGVLTAAANTFTGSLVVLRDDGTSLATYGADQLDVTKLPAFGRGVAYAVTATGLLVAIDSPHATPVSGAWPVAGGDAAFTRRAETRP